LKPAQANSSQDPIAKNIHKDRADRVTQGEGPEFKLQYHKKTKQQKKTKIKNWIYDFKIELGKLGSNQT
jgi:hypothetical protein